MNLHLKKDESQFNSIHVKQKATNKSTNANRDNWIKLKKRLQNNKPHQGI